MITDCIYNIELTTNSNIKISIPRKNFDNLYISNIDDFGDEIPYDSTNSTLSANFFMVKITDQSHENSNFVEEMYKNKNIIKVKLNFMNGLTQEFELSKKRVVNDGVLENKYQQSHYNQDGELCILITDKKIKFKENLFI